MFSVGFDRLSANASSSRFKQEVQTVTAHLSSVTRRQRGGNVESRETCDQRNTSSCSSMLLLLLLLSFLYMCSEESHANRW